MENGEREREREREREYCFHLLMLDWTTIWYVELLEEGLVIALFSLG